MTAAAARAGSETAGVAATTRVAVPRRRTWRRVYGIGRSRSADDRSGERAAAPGTKDQAPIDRCQALRPVRRVPAGVMIARLARQMG
ncbi:hypothetical protein Cci01nite_12860 [Catellatospora citrea]|uniref:Uncharacterized protein n=1 Tax=Catellatospora citrea TaxID=53366 RepID=A0A8J3NXD0_9ACTN|nr:hypothetical protein Cci01nite_12860 [Catellatospora citrea]